MPGPKSPTRPIADKFFKPAAGRKQAKILDPDYRAKQMQHCFEACLARGLFKDAASVTDLVEKWKRQGELTGDSVQDLIRVMADHDDAAGS